MRKKFNDKWDFLASELRHSVFDIYFEKFTHTEIYAYRKKSGVEEGHSRNLNPECFKI